MHLRKATEDFPGGSEGKSPPAHAGDTGSLPSLGRFHKQRGSKPTCHTYWSLTGLELVLCDKRSHHEKPGHWDCRAAPARQLEEARAQQCRPTTARGNLKHPYIWNFAPCMCLYNLLPFPQIQKLTIVKLMWYYGPENQTGPKGT